MKVVVLYITLSLIGACSTPKNKRKTEHFKNKISIKDSSIISNFGKIITEKTLKTLVDTLASKTFNGRKLGSEGLEKATVFIQDFYTKNAIPPAIKNTYTQNIPEHVFPKLKNIKGSNILAYIKGNQLENEVIVISAHIDHLGVKNNEIHYGADDNASGTAAIMQIAQAFQNAKNKGFPPKRSILIAHFTAEEIGLYGSSYYTKNPVFSLKNTIANLNIDMIGRVDEKHKNNPNYIYSIGADKLSDELHFISEKINATLSNLELDYTYNDENDPNRYYYRSDHYNFSSKGVPSIFYFNGTHTDYHKPTDTREKINFKSLEKRTKLVFYTAWHLANMKNKLTLNSNL